MNHSITGLFTVAMQPQAWADAAATPQVAGITTGRMLLDKHYQGELQGHALGQMLSAVTATKGSAGYVAIEVFTGTLLGKRGSFALQHTGTMNRAVPQLSITVVPDSGTDELQGLSGRMGIRISEGAHHYEFEFTLP
jgi:hypothetical protein